MTISAKRRPVADNINATETRSCQVTFQPVGRRVSVPAGTTLLEAARNAGLSLTVQCGGIGICGKCLVTVIDGKMAPPDEHEQAFLSSNSNPTGTRLACEAQIASAVVVELPPGSFNTGQRVQVESAATLSTNDPLIQSHSLHLSPPTLDDSRSDYQRVADALVAATGRSDWTMHPRVARQIRTFDSNLTAYTRGEAIIGFAELGRNALGLAVDIGCTKIAVYLMDLDTGKQLAAAGEPNPQISFGEDLITRLVYAAKSAAQARTLAAIVRQCIDSLAEKLCLEAQVAKQQIGDVCVVGNTAMIHLLLELPVSQLLHAPFVSSIDRDVDISARDLDWQFAPDAHVHVLPSIGGFVGADHVAMILARNIDRSEKVTVGLDIGTNTEIVVRDPRTGKFVTTSVPSGPVFEGGHVADGMRAATGAIDNFFLLDGELKYRTIDDAKPVGICGSGMLDLLAELRRLGCIDELGHLVRSDNRVTRGPCGHEFLVVAAAETEHGRDIVLTQHDITQVQLAKAAIRAGIETLLNISEVSPEAVQELVVAGAFGTYLDLRSAIFIGLLPRFANAEYLQVGNAAGAGAKLTLVSKSQRERARTIAKSATKIDLNRYPEFDRLMARGTRFPATNH